MIRSPWPRSILHKSKPFQTERKSIEEQKPKRTANPQNPLNQIGNKRMLEASRTESDRQTFLDFLRRFTRGDHRADQAEGITRHKLFPIPVGTGLHRAHSWVDGVE